MLELIVGQRHFKTIADLYHKAASPLERGALEKKFDSLRLATNWTSRQVKFCSTLFENAPWRIQNSYQLQRS